MSIIGTGGLGTTTVGELVYAPEAIQEVYSALTVLNGKDIYASVRGAQFLDPFTREIFGGNGFTESHKELIVNGRKGGDGDYRNTVKRKEKVNTRTYLTEATTLGDVDFTNKMIDEAREKNLSLTDLIRPQMESIAKWYTQRYLAYSPYIALLALPTDGGNFWTEFGMCRNTVVPSYYMKPGKSTTRQHWMTIEKTTGVEATDIMAGIQTLAEYVDTMEDDVVIYGSGTTLSKVYTIYNDPINKDIFWRTGEPVAEVGGAKFIKNDMLPTDFLLFVNGGSDFLLTKNQSANPDFRGLGTYREEGVIKFEDEADLVGTKFKVHAESYNMDGRTDALIMDIKGGTGRFHATRVMQSAGITAVSDYVTALEARIDDTYRR